MRIGLFFSRSGGLGQMLDLDFLAGQFAVEYFAVIHDDFFNREDRDNLRREISANALEAVILVGDSPLKYQSRRAGDVLLSEIEELGINPNRVGFVNLQEQLVQVHRPQEQGVMQKAKLLIKVEIARVKLAPLLQVVTVVPRKAVAIFGATAPGYLAAYSLLRRGYKVYLLETRHNSRMRELRDENDLQPAVSAVDIHPMFSFYPGISLKDVHGYAGDFCLEVQSDTSNVSLAVGALILADPADPYLAQEIRPLFHMDIDEQGNFKPLNRDTLRAYTSEQGVFLADNIVPDLGWIVGGADAAVLAVDELLSCTEIRHTIAVSEVRQDLCGGCGTCVKTCLFHACKINMGNKIAEIDPRRCKGCGSCVIACPAGARDLLTYPKAYLVDAVNILAGFNVSKPRLLVFLCEGCGYRAFNAAASAGITYPAGVLPLKVRCGGAIDTQLILEAFLKEFDGVAVCKCQEGHCSNILGNVDLDRRANLFRSVLRSRGIDAERLRILDALQDGGNSCVQAIIDFYHEIQGEGGEIVGQGDLG